MNSKSGKSVEVFFVVRFDGEDLEGIAHDSEHSALFAAGLGNEYSERCEVRRLRVSLDDVLAGESISVPPLPPVAFDEPVEMSVTNISDDDRIILNSIGDAHLIEEFEKAHERSIDWLFVAFETQADGDTQWSIETDIDAAFKACERGRLRNVKNAKFKSQVHAYPCEFDFCLPEVEQAEPELVG